MTGLHGIERICPFYRGIDPDHSDLFHDSHPNDSALSSLGNLNVKWQQLIAATTMVAIVNAVVIGTAAATLIASLKTVPGWALALLGVLTAASIAATFMWHQSKTWRRAIAALPGLIG